MEAPVSIDSLPANAGAFIDEIAEGVHALYGSDAARQYRARAPLMLAANLAHPALSGFAIMKGGNAEAILMSLRRDVIGEISFFHVLRSALGRGIEKRLIGHGVDVLRNSDISGIVSDTVCFSDADLRSVYRDLGFTSVRRQLMGGDLPLSGLTGISCGASRECEKSEWPDLAACMVDAYQGHPGRLLHVEVRNAVNALDFIHRLHAGNYGVVRPGHVRACWRDGRCCGVIFGCELVPGHGFVLQFAVRRAYQNQGIGAILLRDTADAFLRDGLNRIALGVTSSSPARRLYERAGFDFMRHTDAFTWWRDDAD